jgi:dTDP-4-amino-4,6-dideoxygalactose transaminase
MTDRGGAKVPYNKLVPMGRELEYVGDAIRSLEIGPASRYVKACEELLAQILGARAVLLTPSATAALEMSAMLIDLRPGDEVVMPSFSFVSAANAVVLRGAKPRFVDVEPETMNIDCDAVEAAITDRTKAIMPVHYAGVGCDVDRLAALAAGRGLVLVEDAAQGIGAARNGKPLGSVGPLAAISFHETKNVSCGEGGALVVNDPELVDRAHVIRDKGTNRRSFLAGATDKYTWVDIGSSYTVSGLSAAFLLGQLEQLDRITARRLEICARYRAGFAAHAHSGRLVLQRIDPACMHNGHIFFMILQSPDDRNRLIAHLNASGIEAIFHYVPLHSSPFARSHLADQRPLPATDDLASRLVRLPLYASMADADVDRVVDAACTYLDA